MKLLSLEEIIDIFTKLARDKTLPYRIRELAEYALSRIPRPKNAVSPMKAADPEINWRRPICTSDCLEFGCPDEPKSRKYRSFKDLKR
jgi:hypothetical protein